MTTTPDAKTLREAILKSALETSNFGQTPEAKTLYVPPAHLKALRLEASVVVGARGVGKSFWTAVLQSNDLCRLLGDVAPELTKIDAQIGFSNKAAIDDFPDADVFRQLLDKKQETYDIWRAVILRWVARKNNQKIPIESWVETLDWFKSQSEEVARIMQTARNWQGLIVFDALDRTSNDWQAMDEIVRGLLRAVLWLKSFPNLYSKVFLREDQAERVVFNFPDASKLTATKAELAWAKHDLHGLLWQRLINAPNPHGESLRSVCPHSENNGLWKVAQEMKLASDTQKKAFVGLAGVLVQRE